MHAVVYAGKLRDIHQKSYAKAIVTTFEGVVDAHFDIGVVVDVTEDLILVECEGVVNEHTNFDTAIGGSENFRHEKFS